MKKFSFLFVLVLFVACNNTNTGNDNNAPASVNGDEYIFEDISGTDVKRVKKLDTKNKVIEEGFVKDGLKTGEWVTYQKDKDYVSTITPYLNGKLNGTFFEFDKRGYLVSQAGFKNDELDGKVIKYQYGKPTEISEFKNGKLDGKKIVFSKGGKIQEEVEYKNGKIDGFMRYFNDKGEMIMEYKYKNGKKVGTGEINKKINNAPR